MTPSFQNSTFQVSTFYKFVEAPFEASALEILQTNFREFCVERQILGTLLLAPEGINGTLAGSTQDMQSFLDFLRSTAFSPSSHPFHDLETKDAFSNFPPFRKLKVLIKKEIVTMNVPNLSPAHKTGKLIPANEWNTLISDPNVLLIDTRNNYEFAIGSFKRAENPNTESFSEFPAYAKTHLNPKKHKKIAMFCTGGIRCEKASAYLLDQGFEEVYQLQGGILKYLKEMDPAQSLWQGDCFVFDERERVN